MMTQELKSLLGSPAERLGFLEAIQAGLPAVHFERISRLFQLLDLLLNLLEKKSFSLAKLRRLCFGAATESARNVCGQPAAGDQRPAKAKGHGRNSHRRYTGARRVRVAHPALSAGQTCPACAQGKLRQRQDPAVAITVTAQPPVGALIHELEQLRCDTCGKLFTAPLPAQAGLEKYDASVGVMVGLLRYGSGMPFYRLERLQQSLGVPLPASVQWEQACRVAQDLQPVYEHLITQAAQAAVLFNDDTKMQVSSLRKEIQDQDQPKRTGLFTSGIVAEMEEHSVSLFFTGRDHAGENLTAVLAQREAQRSPPLHMCDGLARNAPKGHVTVDCQCNVHARRGFVEVEGSFPAECRKVVESFSVIYRVEAQAKAAGLSAQERLRAHQTESQPVMEDLRSWFAELIETKQVEPNSGLGEAIAYMQTRWTELTQFLRVPGAPLDNNAAERILKMAILHRKNSLFYRTQRGADVGDLFMSLVQTCRSNGVNPFDYMMAVIRNATQVKAEPMRWMPWNYPAALGEPSALSA
jgi:transposase